MYAVKGIYDGKTVQLGDPVPVKEKYDVLITFLNPVDLNGGQHKGQSGKKLSDRFAGALRLSDAQYTDFQKSISESRKEWHRDIY
ncbi:MAG: hypothetical protein LBJ25_03415 [Candidatus Margulisbacteria bacterium]|jgi:hypothetical protein|nr:hypothetical protein [Candidatus Margulisiibacteriota bacterium]